MRVTQGMISRNFISDIERININLAEAGRQMSSGKKLSRLADSPSGSAELVYINNRFQNLETYRSNVNTSSYYLKSAESALNELNNIFPSIYTLGMQAVSGTLSSEVRETLAKQLRETRDHVIALGNSQANGRYLFAGSKTGAAPFELAGGAVGYLGNDDVITVPVDDGVEAVQGVSGSAFSAVFSAIDALTAGLDADDPDAMKAALEQFSGALNDLQQARGRIGVSLNLLENISLTFDAKKTVLSERKSNIEDAGLLDATVRVAELKTALDAALSAGGAILKQRNLFDILG